MRNFWLKKCEKKVIDKCVNDVRTEKKKENSFLT